MYCPYIDTIYDATGMYFKVVVLTKIIEYWYFIFKTVVISKHSPFKQYQILNITLIANWTQNVRLGNMLSWHQVCAQSEECEIIPFILRTQCDITQPVCLIR